MAKGRKTGGRDWKPGETGNPNGSPGLPKDLREARKLNQMELERTVNRFLFMTPTELAAVTGDPTTTMFDRFVARIITLGETEGDERRLEFILQRIVGKVQDRIEVKTPIPFVIRRRTGEELVAGAEPAKDEQT
jgi:hypothetical protein